MCVVCHYRLPLMILRQGTADDDHVTVATNMHALLLCMVLVWPSILLVRLQYLVGAWLIWVAAGRKCTVTH